MYTRCMDLNNYIATRVTQSDQWFRGTPCLEWTLRVHKDRGYGVAKIKGQNKWAHRLSYELHKGYIRPGYTIDHLCFNKTCVNPEHLEAVTMAENNRRYRIKFLGENPTFPCGHSRSGPDVIRTKSGTYNSGTQKVQLRCGPCSKEYNRKYIKEYMKTYRKKMV